MSQLIFEGNIDELIDHFSQSNGTYSGLRFHVFAEPKSPETTVEEDSELVFTRPVNERTEGHEEVLREVGRNSPVGTKHHEQVWQQVDRQFAAGEEGYIDLPTPSTTALTKEQKAALLESGQNSPEGTKRREPIWQELERRDAQENE